MINKVEGVNINMAQVDCDMEEFPGFVRLQADLFNLAIFFGPEGFLDLVLGEIDHPNIPFCIREIWKDYREKVFGIK